MKHTISSTVTFFVAAFLFWMSSVSQALPIGNFIAKRTSTTKYVTAHHIVGNTYSYNISEWEKDIIMAQAANIDAFVLNMGPDSWQPPQINNAYTAAEQLGTGFKMYLSFDMSVMPCSTAADAATLVNLVRQYANHPNQFKYPPEAPKPVVTTFSGESCAFGQSSPAEGWQTQFKNKLTGSDSILFAPSFFVDPATFSTTWGSIQDGALNWNAGWTNTVTESTFTSLLNSIGQAITNLLTNSQNTPAKTAINNLVSSISADTEYINNLQDKPYFTTVSPWFNTHYGSGQFGGKNFVYLAENMYPSRWTSIVNARDQMDVVQLNTVNDYGESHYTRPVSGDQPDSQSWTTDMPHTAFLNMTKYYATAYKTGEYPSIESDEVYVWGRRYPKDASAPDPVGRPANYELLQDLMYVLVLASEPSTVELSTAANPSQNVQTFTVQPGATQFSIPLTVNGGMSAKIVRNGQTVTQVNPPDYKFISNPPNYNFNVFAAMASA